MSMESERLVHHVLARGRDGVPSYHRTLGSWVGRESSPDQRRGAPLRGWVLRFAALLALLVCLSLIAFSQDDRVLDTAAAARGKLVFERLGCFVCHGNQGSGGVRNRNSATQERIPTLTYSSRGFTTEAFKERIRNGSPVIRKKDLRGITPPVSMPPFRQRVAEPEISDLVEYLRSLTPEAGEEPVPVGKERPPAPEYMLAGDSCQICHGAVADKFRTNVHFTARPPVTDGVARFVCIGCHGDGSDHAKKYGDPAALVTFTKDAATPVHDRNAACLQCHERNRQRNWLGSMHETGDLACADCHTVMEPASPKALLANRTETELCGSCHGRIRAQMLRSGHMPLREGKVTCSDCHNAHGTTGEKLLSEPTVNENCYRCHPEKRGPFLWEHPPVAENCLSCHDPHGSNHEKLLTADLPRLCQECHNSGDVHVATPQLAASLYVFNRSCGNCHSQIHGSNSPSGHQLLR